MKKHGSVFFSCLRPLSILLLSAVLPFSGIGKMYACDERFKNNIDKYGGKTAEFASSAIKIYSRR